MQPNAPADRKWQADGPLDPNRYIPLYVLAVEGFGASVWDGSIDARIQNLTHELHDQILYDDCYIAHVPRSLVSAMIREREQAMAEQRAHESTRTARWAAEHQTMINEMRGRNLPSGAWKFGAAQ